MRMTELHLLTIIHQIDIDRILTNKLENNSPITGN
jgi:hypothetical protein